MVLQMNGIQSNLTDSFIWKMCLVIESKREENVQNKMSNPNGSHISNLRCVRWVSQNGDAFYYFRASGCFANGVYIYVRIVYVSNWLLWIISLVHNIERNVGLCKSETGALSSFASVNESHTEKKQQQKLCHYVYHLPLSLFLYELFLYIPAIFST